MRKIFYFPLHKPQSRTFMTDQGLHITVECSSVCCTVLWRSSNRPTDGSNLMRFCQIYQLYASNKLTVYQSKMRKTCEFCTHSWSEEPIQPARVYLSIWPLPHILREVKVPIQHHATGAMANIYCFKPVINTCGSNNTFKFPNQKNVNLWKIPLNTSVRLQF